MEAIIIGIQKTPIPTILIFAGLFFVLLGFTTKLGGFIEVSADHKKLTIPIGVLILITGLVLTIFPVIQVASAEQVGPPPGWWQGSWECKVDGRPAKMNWDPVNDDPTSCNGDTCTINNSAKWKGSFSDNGSIWVPLTYFKRGKKGGVFFYHSDGNKWYLALPVGTKTEGQTNWEGQRKPLTCWR